MKVDHFFFALGPCEFAKRFLIRGRAVDVSALSVRADDEFSDTLTGHLPSYYKVQAYLKCWLCGY